MPSSLRSNKNGFVSRLLSKYMLQRLKHTIVDPSMPASNASQGKIDVSMWKKVNARAYGITRRMISPDSLTVLQALRRKGFEAYLVGGCVRDLLLKRVPKDFDVITNASLKQVRKQFNKAIVIGRRFPICLVRTKGSVVEISSFNVVAQNDVKREEAYIAQMPPGCDDKDILRWRNSLHRDFTINSLFYDPFKDRIYDYTNGMKDIRSFKLRTLGSAQESFSEDCARILRGLRLAARLSFSLSKDTEAAMRSRSSSIQSLDKSRILMELNYMLSYGAAEPSLSLLRRFNILELLLPFHAAYLDQQANKGADRGSIMLMKLFFNLDKLVGCDRPSHCNIWVALLAFHLALVNNPQPALVLGTLSSVLYHGSWNEGIKFGIEQDRVLVNFSPETSEPVNSISDKKLQGKVTHLASLVQASVDALMNMDSLVKSMSRFKVSPCHGSVFVSSKTGKEVVEIFNVLVKDITSYKENRRDFQIDYNLLVKGDVSEIRFVLGKVILDTMRGRVVGKEVKVNHGLCTSANDQMLNAACKNKNPTSEDSAAVTDVQEERPASSKLKQQKARGEKLPEEIPASSKLKQQKARGEKRPEESPAASKLKQKKARGEKRPEESPAASKLKQQKARGEKRPEESPDSSKLKQQKARGERRPEESPASSKLKQQKARGEKRPEESPASSKLKQQKARGEKRPGESPASSKLKQQKERREKRPEESPASSELKQQKERGEKRPSVEKCNKQGVLNKKLKAVENRQEINKVHEVIENNLNQENNMKHEKVNNTLSKLQDNSKKEIVKQLHQSKVSKETKRQDTLRLSSLFK